MRRVSLDELEPLPAPSSLWEGIDGNPGADGRDGRDGLPGAPGVAGKDALGFNFQGPWLARHTYDLNDVVRFEGSLWVASAPSRGRAPRDRSQYWKLLLPRGERGRDGDSIQGPRGRRGADGITIVGGGSEPIAFIADTDIGAGQPLRVTSAGHCTLASATELATAEVAALAVSDTANGAAGIMQAGDTLELPDWSSVTGSPSLTAGLSYYLSETTGMLTTTAPEQAEGVCIVYVGRAVSATALLIEIANPVVQSDPATYYPWEEGEE